jgi:hypothetical protein
MVASVLFPSDFGFGKANVSLSMLKGSATPTEVVKSGIYWLTLKTTTVLPQFKAKPDCVVGHRGPPAYLLQGCQGGLRPHQCWRGRRFQSRYLRRLRAHRAQCGTDVSLQKWNLGLDYEDRLIIIISKWNWSNLLLKNYQLCWVVGEGLGGGGCLFLPLTGLFDLGVDVHVGTSNRRSLSSYPQAQTSLLPGISGLYFFNQKLT